jgi:uncharacterized protein (TIGR02231 family)
MRETCIAAVAGFLVLNVAPPASGVEIQTGSRIEAVTVYPDGATVTRVIGVNLQTGDTTIIARDFPPTLDPASLRVEGEAQTRLLIGSIDARAPRVDRPPVNPELEKRIEALKDERAALDDRIAAAAARRKFAERFADSSPAGLGEKGEARPLAEWRAAFTAIAEEIAAADAVIRETRLRQREIDRELARIAQQTQADPPRKMEVRIELAAEAATAATLRVSYSVRGARWVPLYDARLDTSRPDRPVSLELVRRAEIVQNTGEDWADVGLAVSTVRTASGTRAPELASLIVRYPEPPRPVAAPRAAAPPASYAPDQIAGRRGDQLAPTGPLEERRAAVETAGFQVLFRIPGRVSVPANEGAKSFRIVTATLAPELLVRAAPALDETAFLEASFRHAEEAPLLPGRIALYRDGIFVGRGQMTLTPKDEFVRLGFGADDKVKVTRSTVRKSEAQSGIISSSKTDERTFKIMVRNGHATPIKIAIEDQLPVSELDEVKVELLPVTTAPSERDARDRRGVLVWVINPPPGESREIWLAWRVRWPADKSIVFDQRRP